MQQPSKGVPGDGDRTDRPPGPDSDLDLVDARIAELLALWDPAAAPSQVWGCQFDVGLAWVDFPVGLGGLGLSVDMQEYVDSRLRSAGVPENRHENFVGLGMAARTLVANGTSEQKATLLRPIFTCEEIWCQLFSEPGAGSDLASLSTAAARHGDDWIVNGHKVWTSFGHRARWGLLLARTDTTVAKHKGLTFFVVDMTSHGVDVRPIRQITGEREFNEVFLTDVPVPDSARLGAPGEGWAIALGTLTNERAAVGSLALEGRGEGPIRLLTSIWAEATSPSFAARDRVAQCWIRAEVARLTMLRARALQERERAGPESAIVKLLVSELRVHLYEECVNLLGADGMLGGDYDVTSARAAWSAQHAFLDARQLTIGGGTSEIARNILGERTLGLPPEPRLSNDGPRVGPRN